MARKICTAACCDGLDILNVWIDDDDDDNIKEDISLISVLPGLCVHHPKHMEELMQQAAPGKISLFCFNLI